MFYPENLGKNKVAFAALVLACWTSYGLFFGTQGFLRSMSSGNKNASLSSFIITCLICGYSWALLTVPLLRFVNRFSLNKLGWSAFLLVHIPAAPVIGSLALALYVVLAVTFIPRGRSIVDFYQNVYLDEIQSEILVYLMFVGIATVYQRLFRREPEHRPVYRPLGNERAIPTEGPSSSPATNGHTNGQMNGHTANGHANGQMNGHAANVHANGNGYLRRISIKDNGRITLVDADNIKWISSYGNYLKIHTTETRYLYRETMTAIEKKLDPALFVRIRRSAIVRIDQIKEMHPVENGEFEIVLSDGTVLGSTRRYRKNLEPILKS